MIGRRRFLKLALGLGTTGAGYGWFRREGPKSSVLLAQASFESTISSTPSKAPATAPTRGSVAISPESIAAVLIVISKLGWGANPVVGTFVEHRISRITVHHTASLLTSNSNAPARLRQHQAYHQNDQGWPDLAYHYVVDRNGHIYEGRPLWAAGDTSTDYDPTGHLLIACEGNFNDQDPSEAQLLATAGLLAWGAEIYGIGLETVLGHRDVASTSCPGDAVYARMDSLVDHARLLQGGRGIRVETLDDQSGLGLVADIEAGRI